MSSESTQEPELSCGRRLHWFGPTAGDFIESCLKFVEQRMSLLAHACQSIVILVAAGVWHGAAAQESVRDQAGDSTRPTVSSAGTTTSETGLAAVYSDKLHGHKTASGQRYDRNKLTAAHKTLPFGTQVKITNLKTNQTVNARINDRGPTQAGRILDISPAVAKSLGIKPKAMAEVRMEVVEASAKGSKG